jgi:hypothetical protein
MLKDLMDRDRSARDYGLPRELASLPPTPQSIPMIDLPAVQDFAPETFGPDDLEISEEFLDGWGVEIPPLPADASEHEKQLRTWALQTEKQRRGGATIDPALLPQTHGQESNEQWAAQTEAIRQGKSIPAIRRPSNRALRELRCPNCQCEFTAEVES